MKANFALLGAHAILVSALAPNRHARAVKGSEQSAPDLTPVPNAIKPSLSANESSSLPGLSQLPLIVQPPLASVPGAIKSSLSSKSSSSLPELVQPPLTAQPSLASVPGAIKSSLSSENSSSLPGLAQPPLTAPFPLKTGTGNDTGLPAKKTTVVVVVPLVVTSTTCAPTVTACPKNKNEIPESEQFVFVTKTNTTVTTLCPTTDAKSASSKISKNEQAKIADVTSIPAPPPKAPLPIASQSSSPVFNPRPTPPPTAGNIGNSGNGSPAGGPGGPGGPGGEAQCNCIMTVYVQGAPPASSQGSTPNLDQSKVGAVRPVGGGKPGKQPGQKQPGKEKNPQKGNKKPSKKPVAGGSSNSDGGNSPNSSNPKKTACLSKSSSKESNIAGSGTKAPGIISITTSLNKTDVGQPAKTSNTVNNNGSEPKVTSTVAFRPNLS